MSAERHFTISSELFKKRPPTEKHVVEESPRVKEVAEKLGKNIFGQDEAVHLLASRIAHNEHFDNKDQTKGNFFLYGPPGVGKTQLSIELAKFFHGDDWESHFIKLDGTDFKNQTSLGRLKGSDPNYVGYGDKLRISSDFLAKDNVVIVLDEIEKSCPEFREYWLPVMDKGKAVAREGNKKYGSANDTVMDYRNVWLISTSNVGSAEMNKSPIGIGTSSMNQTRQEKGQKAFRELFAVMPEWISRLGENNAVVLNTLQPEHYGMIINKFLGELNGTQKGRYNPVYVTEALLTRLYADANIDKYGARDIQHSIKRLIAPQVSAVKDKHKPEDGLPILLHYDDDTKTIQTAIGDEPETDPRLKKTPQASPIKPPVSPAPIASVEKFYDAKRKMSAEEKFLWGATAATIFLAIAQAGRRNKP